MAECKSKDQWAKGHKALYRKFILAKSDRFPPRDSPLTLSEWFFIHHKSTWAPLIQKEVKLIRYFQLFNDYRYVHKLPEVQLGQFQGAIASLKIENPVNCSFKVDFATLQILDSVFLPKLHSLVMDSSVGSVIFERFARVMGRISAQQGRLPSFQRFIFWEFHLGHITSEVSLGKDEYATFLEAQRQLHIKRMLPVMGSSYSITYGVFQTYFEEQECKALRIIQRHASLLSPAFYLHSMKFL
ncbi:hypothetical protein Taro_053661 [Colocasia esculenta]|uniref:Uncharacterized protein n=1 Tax=Colocasia esculenta TaxID=4460 RepID=A0A843XNW1_COLES|nr:hypothetical protein [Colocasia esculenta]